MQRLFVFATTILFVFAVAADLFGQSVFRQPANDGQQTRPVIQRPHTPSNDAVVEERPSAPQESSSPSARVAPGQTSGFFAGPSVTPPGNAPIVEIRIQSNKDKQVAREPIRGFQMIDHDLDEGMSGFGSLHQERSNYIYMFYRRSWDEKPIRDLRIVEDYVPAGFTSTKLMNCYS